jgi:hypothetical protein
MNRPLSTLFSLAPMWISAVLGAAASAAPAAPTQPAPAALQEATNLADLAAAITKAEEAEEAETIAAAAVLPDDAPPRLTAAALPSFDAEPPAGKSAPPLWKEWRGATEIGIASGSPACRVTHVREWVRVKCDLGQETLAEMALIAGSREGVSFGHNEFGPGYDVVFPVRRGDRRVFQIVKVASWSKYSVEYDAAFAITEAWLPGAASPVITVD